MSSVVDLTVSNAKDNFLENVHPSKLARLDDRMVRNPLDSSQGVPLEGSQGVGRGDGGKSASQIFSPLDSEANAKSLKRPLLPSSSDSRPSKSSRTLTRNSPMGNAVASQEAHPAVSKAQQRIELLEKENQTIRKQLEEKQQLLDQHEILRDQREKQREAMSDRLVQTKAALMSFVKKEAEADRKEAKRKWVENIRALGRVEPDWGTINSAAYGEVWVEGERFTSLRARQVALDAERSRVKRQKAAIRKQINAQAPDQQDPLHTLNLEILNSHNATLLAEDKSLHAELLELVLQKTMHLRETKRIRDEENCKFNDFPILKERYVLVELLGKGGFSEVYKAYDAQLLRYVACKVHQLNPLWSEARKANYSRHSIREYNIHKTLDHPQIIRFFDIFEIDENSFCTVLNFCKGGDVDSLLKRHGTLSLKLTRVILAQVVQGLDYLHSQTKPIIHYDLKPANILFDSGRIKITDFGLSKQLDDVETGVTDLTSQGAGTYWYLPPECFVVGSTPPQISPKVDVWSTGVIAYQLLFGKKPFGQDMTQQNLMANNIISHGIEVKFPTKPAISEEAQHFIRRCLVSNPTLRPSTADLLKHPFISAQNLSLTHAKMNPPASSLQVPPK
eukprot:TRINITY_DN1387_c0_g1_i1.p1 TRINITY_DN1387_c0_g1~~TRINITY_DN1387_c0_g1_i1.p1  ORF type:complete len:619 (+),score=106.50 TRINITY_DN1387_c0_g1_i1:24-1880(+)